MLLLIQYCCYCKQALSADLQERSQSILLMTIILAKTLDHDSGVTNYTLTVIVENVGLNDTAILYITVVDVNDHTPAFVLPPQQSTTLKISEVR